MVLIYARDPTATPVSSAIAQPHDFVAAGRQINGWCQSAAFTGAQE